MLSSREPSRLRDRRQLQEGAGGLRSGDVLVTSWEDKRTPQITLAEARCLRVESRVRRCLTQVRSGRPAGRTGSDGRNSGPSSGGPG